MKPSRNSEQIQRDLRTALAYRATYEGAPSDDALIQQMRRSNELEISELKSELGTATSAELEISLNGTPVAEHAVAVPFFQRVLDQLQTAFRSIRRAALPPGMALPRRESALLLSGTAPGSFRAFFRTPPVQLELSDLPQADLALLRIVELLGAAHGESSLADARRWAATADEPAVRAMIKLSATLAAAHGRTTLRLRTADGAERIVDITSDQARQLALALAGETGREVLTVTGHLQMAQDEPPRVRITTAGDQFLAEIPDESGLLDKVKELLFLDVVATLVVDLRTSATTGAPSIRTELLDLDQS